eukprot:CAMPEP_0198724978 /NCGR_PEP_ID=MMETSP1475-20131203/2355_1 /TAXON_ID= ORGANISM="Unidentified sp., Strain CCMP1999" /NCGR_SAMPLE_ID=MMETSP1475 /ASSEMBLY_ACC=CAM_ASM_001111 /LENGTH=118 /DNA_ID=CAMNT_0044486635 /DNA_START=941 /DNA_END=1294 /DNA_ORIENTATION=-
MVLFTSQTLTAYAAYEAALVKKLAVLLHVLLRNKLLAERAPLSVQLPEAPLVERPPVLLHQLLTSSEHVSTLATPKTLRMPGLLRKSQVSPASIDTQPTQRTGFHRDRLKSLSVIQPT